jgi:hypothetical protein
MPTLVWAGNFMVSALLPGYRSDSTLNFVFMTIVGGALALRVRRLDRAQRGQRARV